MDMIYNFEFADAQKNLIEIKKRFPNHPIYHFISAMYCYWEMVPIAINHPRYKTYEYHLLKTIELSMLLLQKKVHRAEACFYLMGAHSSLIVVHSKNGDLTKAISEARKTYIYMKEGFEYAERYPDFNFSTGLYYFYAAQFPETYPAILPVMWFFTKGDKEKGVNYLKRSTKTAVFSKSESMFFLSHLYLKYFNQPSEAVKYTHVLAEKYPNNSFYIARHTEALILQHQYQEAKPLVEKLLKNPIDFFQMSGYLFSGMIEMYDNHDYAGAKKDLEKSLQIAATTKKQTADYESFAHLCLGLISEKEHNYKKAMAHFDIVDQKGEYTLHQAEVKAFKQRMKARNR